MGSTPDRTGTALPESVRSLLPLTPAVFYVLFALSREEQHGYAIMQSVESLSDGVVSMGPGTLYSTIQRLVNLDLVEETTPARTHDAQGRHRRFYRITQLGRRTFDTELQRMKDVLRQVRVNRLLPSEEPKA